MRTDVSRLSFDEGNHFLAVFQQMGRLPLDADFNEQNELMLRLVQRLAGDAVHTGSPNEGFRVDTRVLLDRLDSRRGWSATPAAASLFVDYFDYRVGDGSLAVKGASAVTRRLERPLDLSGMREALIAVKGGFAAASLVLTLTDSAGAAHDCTMNELAPQASGWRVFQALPGTLPAGFRLAEVAAFAFTGLEPLQRYAFDSLKADLPVRVTLTRDELPGAWSATPAAAALSLDDDQRIWGALAVKASGASTLTYALPAPVDLRRRRALRIALRRTPSDAPYALELVDSATTPQSVSLSSPNISSLDGWEILSFVLPESGSSINWGSVARIRLSGLAPNRTYAIGPVQVEADPAADLVIMGGDGSAEGAGRFYGDGVAATKERHETYTTQRDLPEPDLAALAPLAASSLRIDWAYLDLWERPVTYIEKPALREPALEGLDTGTRTQLIAQVRLLAGQAVADTAEPQPPAAAFATLPRWGKGTLTTKDTPAAILDPCADPCEPALGGPYLGEENRLFRIEIHKAGDIGPASAAGTALFKWSRDNGAVASALVAEAPAGATSAQVEKPELFLIGELIEISDDLVELATGPAEDTAAHRNHRRGEMRRIETIDLQARRISWERPGAPASDLHAPLTRAMRLAYHAKVTKWDGMQPATPGDIALADGVTVELGGRDFIPGDYWLFTTRTLDRSVERLIEAPPRGIRHSYYLLAAVRRSRGASGPESAVVDDLRPRFAPLPRLDASRVGFDPGFCATATPAVNWSGVQTVQQAIEAICRADLNADLRLHHRMLHGFGVVCGLKMRCLMSDRAQAVLGPGYAIDCEGYTIHVDGDRALPVVQRAADQGLLDSSGDGEVALVLERGGTVSIEPYVPQDFWESVLEGSLIKDFIDDCFMDLFNLVRAQLFPPGFGSIPPVKLPFRRLMSLLNLFAAWFNPSSGPYVFISKTEHDLLAALYQTLRDELQSETTFCGLFDNLRQYPAYPYAEPVGIETVFGMGTHKRMKLSADGGRAYAYGQHNDIHVFDLTTREMVEVLTFPGGSNAVIQDIAVEPAAGGAVHVVATMENPSSPGGVDSMFATLTLAGGVHAWGATTVVCDVRFSRLAMHAARPGVLYATGRSTDITRRGLYALTPGSIPPTPMPAVNFNAAGPIALNAAGDRAYVAANGPSNAGADTDVFDRLRYIGLNPVAHQVFSTTINGNAEDDDLVFFNDVPNHVDQLYITGVAGSSTAKRLHAFHSSSGALSATDSFDIGGDGPYRLLALQNRKEVWVACADDCKIRVFQVAAGAFRSDFRVPGQLFPSALCADPAETGVALLNLLGNTINLVNVAQVSSTGAPPSYTSDTANTLPQYHLEAMGAFQDMLGVLAQYIKDCFCDKFLVECPTCDPAKDRIYLGSIEIRGRRVHNICNFTRRHYAKSFRTWSYWLSTVPVLPLIKRAFALFACKVL
jgi:hypothetical protein